MHRFQDVSNAKFSAPFTGNDRVASLSQAADGPHLLQPAAVAAVREQIATGTETDYSGQQRRGLRLGVIRRNRPLSANIRDSRGPR